MNRKMEYIIASAGTGKTETLLNKIESLIVNKHIDISKIVMITFTNKATNEIKTRLKERLIKHWKHGYDVKSQIDKINMAKISTIHSFCDDIVREFGLLLDISPNYKITGFNQELNEVIDLTMEKHYDEKFCTKIPTYIIKDMLKKFYNEMDNKGIVFSNNKNIKIKNFWDEFRNYFYMLYDALIIELTRLKKEKNILTNNDLLHYAAKLTENNSVLIHLASKFDAILVDEGQDINIDQKNLLLNLKQMIPLIIVGDEKQSIYAFRGSNMDAFRDLIYEMEQDNAIKSINNINYRSSAELINILNKLFNSNFYFQGIKLNFKNIDFKPYSENINKIANFKILYEESLVEITKKLAQSIAIEDKNSDNKIAILCRSNNEVNSVANTLKDNGIGVTIYSLKSIYKSKAVIDLYKVLRYIVTLDEVDFNEIFYTDYYLSAIKFLDEQRFAEILKGLSFEIKNETISYVLNRLIDLTQINSYYKSLRKDQYIANINRIKEIVRDLLNQGLSTIEILDYFNIMIDTQQMEQEPEVNTNDKIIVSTIHAFKGLTADSVIIYHADRNLYRDDNILYEFDETENKLCFNKDAMSLSNKSLPEDKEFVKLRNRHIIKNLEEELRLMYVACTRARLNLIIFNKHKRRTIDFIIERNRNYVSYTRWILESKLFKRSLF